MRMPAYHYPFTPSSSILTVVYNVPKVLPVILKSIQKDGKAQYLLIQSIKDMLQSSSALKLRHFHDL
ncbi:hypothetical protein HZ326_26919 [Fusarium oxysporum f. sp. albedinis]|nr:hypothetical protein HZ326_26919 [Fusarium oxysporum f. sp. albedinis]